MVRTPFKPKPFNSSYCFKFAVFLSLVTKMSQSKRLAVWIRYEIGIGLRAFFLTFKLLVTIHITSISKKPQHVPLLLLNYYIPLSSIIALFFVENNEFFIVFLIIFVIGLQFMHYLQTSEYAGYFVNDALRYRQLRMHLQLPICSSVWPAGEPGLHIYNQTVPEAMQVPAACTGCCLTYRLPSGSVLPAM